MATLHEVLKQRPILMQNEFLRPFRPSKDGDVGHDLFVRVEEQNLIERVMSKFVKTKVNIIWPWTTKLLRSGIKLCMNSSTWCQIVGRSSTGKKRLMVLGGMIDSGYQGELFTVLANFSFTPRLIKDGERYSQVIFYEAHRPHFMHVYQFPIVSERSVAGFGSSGR